MLKEKASHKIVMTRLRYALTGKYQSYNKYYYYAPFFSVHNMDTSFLFCKVSDYFREEPHSPLGKYPQWLLCLRQNHLR